MTSTNSKTAVAVLGGDARQISAAVTLAEQGFSVSLWGVGEMKEIFASVRCCASWTDAISLADAFLLPLPVTVDGVHLNCPLAPNGEALRMDVLLEHAKGRLVLGGRFSESFLNQAEEKQVHCVDYFASEILQIKNALPTAEGAIETAMRELPVTVDGIHAAVIGYGRIGALLSQKLLALGARVTVYARRQESLTRAELHHCGAVLLREGNEAAVLAHLPRDVRVIFNTVPVRLFTSTVIRALPRGCVFIDLASAPGGIDHTEARREGVPCVWATALPGKYAPETAGRIIAETASLFLRAEDGFAP